MKKLAIGNGKYMKDGIEKTRWVNVGVIGVGQNGKEYMMIDPTINFAAFKRDEGRDMVMVSIFDDSQNTGQNQNNNQNNQQQGNFNNNQNTGQPPIQYENSQGQQQTQQQYNQNNQQR